MRCSVFTFRPSVSALNSPRRRRRSPGSFVSWVRSPVNTMKSAWAAVALIVAMAVFSGSPPRGFDRPAYPQCVSDSCRKKKSWPAGDDFFLPGAAPARPDANTTPPTPISFRTSRRLSRFDMTEPPARQNGNAAPIVPLPFVDLARQRLQVVNVHVRHQRVAEVVVLPQQHREAPRH